MKPQDNTHPESTSQQGRKKKVEIEQHGEGSGAVGGSINQGPCSVAVVGGSNNQATANCTSVDRHLSEQQKAALANLVVPHSVKVTLTMTADDEVQTYGNEIIRALKIAPVNWSVVMMWSGGWRPQGASVHIHGPEQPQELREFALRLSQILGATPYIDNLTPAGEVNILLGKVSSER